MTWNPFQYRFSATYLSNEGDEAILELRKGSSMKTLNFPKSFLPVDLQIGASFSLKLEDNETAQSSELNTLKQLLSNLIQ